MKKLLIICFIVLNIVGYAQQRVLSLREIKQLLKDYPYQGGYRPMANVVGYCLLDKPQLLDSSRLRVTYDVAVRVDTLSDKRVRDRMTALIGDTYYKFYSQFCWQLCMNHTVRLSREETKAASGWMRDYDGTIVNAAIYRNQRARRVTNRSLLPRIDKLVFEYEEPFPRIDWLFSTEKRIVEGYSCSKATCRLAGRDWTVWYTTEIPVDGGLWKFNGLPGLILEAYDRREHYHFTVVGIEQKSEPLVRYKTPTKKMDRNAYRKRERAVYAAPIAATQGPEGYLVISRPGSDRQELLLADDYVDLPYNPLELE